MEFNASDKPTKPAIICDDRQLNWAELDAQVDQAAAFLFEKVGPSDTQQVIGLLFPNGWQFVVAYLAILRLGHIALPLDPTYKKLELGAIIDQIKPLIIVTSDSYKDSVSGHDANIYIFGESKNASSSWDFKSLRLPADKQIASLVFTSGTTGKPKAATYSHANHIWNIVVCSEVWEWNEKDSLLISLPLSHWYGLVMGLAGILYHGNTLYIQEWFDEEKTLQALASGKITMFTHISTVYFRLLEVKGSYDISGVRLCISGGAALPPEIWQKFKSRFGQEILECYGSSETGRIASNLLDERIPGSPGRILPQVEQKFSENNEVLIRSPGLFPGYFNNGEATKVSYTADGWWKTGDIGEMQDGRIVLKGRVQERIRRFGYTLSPRDIEWALHKYPKIKEVYVMGQQQEGQPNDSLIYFVAGDVAEAEIHEFCKENLPYAWRPDSIIMLGSIPRTRNGKPRLSQLKAMVA
ncbi:MAG: class I adenylate-forming enzyme family protein [Candidatus Saccharimonadales bacterium]